jgi:signal transduction histidine kinase/CheY-like chemotaxis protein
MFASITAQNKTSEGIKVSRDKVTMYILEAKNNIKSDQYYQARNDLDDALKYARNINDNALVGLVHSEIGELMLLMQEYDEAELSFQKALLKQEILNNKTALANSYSGLGDTYLNLFRYDSAKKYYRLAEVVYSEANDIDAQMYAILKKAIVHYRLDEFSLAIEEFDKCISRAKTKNSQDVLSAAYIYKGHIVSRLIDLERGRLMVYQGLSIAEENNYSEILKQTFFIISEIQERIGNLAESNKYLKKHIRFNDSLNAIKDNKLSTKKRLEFLKSDQTEYQLEKIENLQELKDTKTENKIITMLGFAFFTILSLFTISLYKNNTIRKKSNNELSVKNKELILAKETAELATKAKANFLSTVTHELRTPLYAVTGLTNMLIEENPKEEQKAHLTSLKFSGDYLLTFINDILDVNKIEAQKVDLETEVFNLKSKAKNIILALSNAQPKNNVKIHLDYDKDLPNYFVLDQVKISQILINLIGNSIKFTKNGDVWVRILKTKVEEEKYTLHFEVEDNGIGISKEKQENIFESFSQGSIEINRKYGGTGLGLSIVKGLVGILGGTINLESEIGKGTKFYFEIDVKKGEKKTEIKQIEYFKGLDPSKLQNINVLIVEDNKINQMITQKTLSKMNIKSDIVDNGEAAVELVKEKKHNVILMDIHMPGISGVEATKQIREFDTDLIIFALTAVTLDDKINEFKSAGFTDVISKPFKQEVFEKILFTELTKQDIIS